MSAFSYYDLLGVDRSASTAEIRAAWIRANRIAHPDVGGSSAQSALFNIAYDVLQDPAKRTAYDRSLNDGDDEPVTSPARSEATTNSAPRPPTWWRPELKSQPVAVTPGFDKPRRRWIVWASVYALLSSPLALVGAPIGLMFYVAMFTLAMPRRWRRRLPLQPLLVGLGRLAIAMLVFAAVIAPLAGSSGWPVSVYFGSMLAALRATIHAARDMDGSQPIDVKADRMAVYTQNTWGSPGCALFSAIDFFGQDRVDAGQLGERLTAQILQPVLDIPGCKMFHGLPWPGRPRADIDHALLCGNQVVLIDSKLWQPGAYSIDEHGALLRNGRHFRGGDTHMREAVRAWQNLLPEARVSGWIVIHCESGSVSVPTPSPGLCNVTNAVHAAEFIGAQLLPHSGTVHRRTLARLLTHPNANV